MDELVIKVVAEEDPIKHKAQQIAVEMYLRNKLPRLAVLRRIKSWIKTEKLWEEIRLEAIRQGKDPADVLDGCEALMKETIVNVDKEVARKHREEISHLN